MVDHEQGQNTPVIIRRPTDEKLIKQLKLKLEEYGKCLKEQSARYTHPDQAHFLAASRGTVDLLDTSLKIGSLKHAEICGIR